MKMPWINRETSWIAFNNRVLFEATDPFNPPLERLKFLAIVSSNLEEFFMIRVAVLKRQLKREDFRDPSGENAKTILSSITKEVKSMLKNQYHTFYKLCEELRKNGITILTKSEDILPYYEKLKEFFDDTLFPLLTPLSVSQTHPFPTLHSGKLYMLIELSPPPDHILTEKPSLSFIEIPVVVGRFYEVQNSVFVPIEMIIKMFLPKIYPGYTIQHCGFLRITRDADYEHQIDGAFDIVSSVEKNIKHFHKREAVKLEITEGISPPTIKTFCDHHNLSEDLVFSLPSILNLKDLMQIYETCDRPDSKLKPLEPVLPRILTQKRNLFSLIRQKEILLFHPYQSYDPVLWFLESAATDPDVIAIKQTLYRTSNDSRIIFWLTKAAENGKYVSVVDELTARFDEQRNIHWARKLQDAGAHVTYGIAQLKTHAKALLIVRREREGIRRYVHLATGNYNETTARLYSDFSFFTTNEEICSEVNQMFNLLTGFSLAPTWKKLAIAPFNLRQRFLSLIRREIQNAKAGLKAHIRAKMNSLSDETIIRALYEASQAGVRIELIVRGICCLIPGIKGISDNITVKSIVGRYLEHSRIYFFYNNGIEEYYLSSADWMMRNLDRRIELLFPIEEPSLKAMLDTILTYQLKDTANSWILKSNGKYEALGTRDSKHHDSFSEIYTHLQQLSEKNT